MSETDMQQAEQTLEGALNAGEEPDDGLGDDEELEIGGKIAGMRQGPVVETTTQQEVTNTVTQNVTAVEPGMMVPMDPSGE